MSTEEYFLIKNINVNMEKIKIPKYSKDEIDIIEKFIEFTRHLQEIDKLFHVFQMNLQDILLHYELYYDDRIIRKIDIENEEKDIIIINALVINYISSAKTFTESIEIFLTQNLGKEELNKFKNNCLSKIYDKKFSYRLLIRLRDYAQHGHLPVHMSADKRCSFDLQQIINTPHFQTNKKLKNELIELSKEICNKFGDNPRIAFTRSLAEFQLNVLEIYSYFIKFIKEALNNLKIELDNLIKKRPDIINISTDALNGFIFYKIENEAIHCFNPKDKPIEMINNIKKQLENLLKKEKEEYQKLIGEKIDKI